MHAINDKARLREFIYDFPPSFHFWNNAPQKGGFGPPFFDFFEKVLCQELGDENEKICESNGLMILETGAGLSSLFFLSLGFKVTSFSLPDVIERIEEFFSLESLYSYRNNWSPHAGRSEFLLPVHVAQEDPIYSACLIDGCHSVHSVFTDFIYAHESLMTGGVLFIDDTHFPGPSLLAQMVGQLDNYELCGSCQKLKAFKKTNGRKIYDNMTNFVFRHPAPSVRAS